MRRPKIPHTLEEFNQLMDDLDKELEIYSESLDESTRFSLKYTPEWVEAKILKFANQSFFQKRKIIHRMPATLLEQAISSQNCADLCLIELELRKKKTFLQKIFRR